MAKDAARRLKRYVQEKCGDDLRTVVLITEDGWDGIYLRDDLKKKYTRTVYGETVELFRPTEDTQSSSDLTLPLGTRHATIFHHDEAFVMRFRYTWNEHILVSVSPGTGHDLLDFLGDCRTIVQGDKK